VNRLRILVHFPRLALIARCHDGAWWELDEWHPRCDPRIPLTAREPQANYGCSPGKIAQPWLRAAARWQLGTLLEAGDPAVDHGQPGADAQPAAVQPVAGRGFRPPAGRAR
jgi:hypothetical protein